MKISKEHLEHIKTECNKIINPQLIAKYELGDFPRSDKVNNLNTRFMFDVFNYAVPSKWVCDNLYPYLNDEHIHTALRSFLPKLEKRYI